MSEKPETQLSVVEGGSGREDWKLETFRLLKSKPAQRVLGALALLVVLRSGINLFMHRHHKANAPGVAVTKPEYRNLDSSLGLPGNVEAIEQASLYAHISGYLKKIHVDEGDKVKKGQLLAEIDAPDVVQEYRKAKAGFDLKEVTFKRQQELLKEQVISEQEFDNAQAENNEARAKFDNAAANLSYTRITAPFTGSIARRFKYPGDLISGGTKGSETPIFILINEDQLRVSVHVPQSELASVTVGRPVAIRLDGRPNEVYHGTVSRLDALLDEATKTERVLIDLEDPKHEIHAGMFASVILNTEHKEHVLTVPKSVIQETGDKNTVMVVRDGKARRVPVTLGLVTADYAEVTQGLQPTDDVITQGAAALTDGVEVNVLSSPKATSENK